MGQSSKPQANHKTEIYSKYVQDKEKVIKVYEYRNSPVLEGWCPGGKEQKNYKTEKN